MFFFVPAHLPSGLKPVLPSPLSKTAHIMKFSTDPEEASTGLLILLLVAAFGGVAVLAVAGGIALGLVP